MTALTDLLANIGVSEETGDAFNVEVEPVELALPLQEQQVVGVDHVLRDPAKRYAYLGMKMGTGKTPTAICLAASFAKAFDQPTLIIVPPSLRFNWRHEMAKFAPWLSFEVIEGTKGGEVPAVDVIIAGDTICKGKKYKDESGYKKFAPTGWTRDLAGKVANIIVDEVHRFKNDSTRSRALAYLGMHCNGYKIGMSGTPAPNGRNQELARQIDFLGSGAWSDIGGKSRFYEYFAPETNEWGARTSAHNAELNNLMSEHWYYRCGRDENKSREQILIEGTGKAKQDYLLAEEDLIAFLAGEGRSTEGAQRSEALVKMNTLRRLAGVARAPGVAKRAKERLSDIDGGLFVTAEHTEVIDILARELAEFNPVIIDGRCKDIDKERAVYEFTQGNSRVLIGQTTAAGVGLTLHGGGRNHEVLVAQIPWTPADLNQLEDRLDRIGQTEHVNVEVSLCAIPEADGGTTIDERLWGQLDTKNFKAGELEDGEGTFLLEDTVNAVLDSYRK